MIVIVIMIRYMVPRSHHTVHLNTTIYTYIYAYPLPSHMNTIHTYPHSLPSHMNTIHTYPHPLRFNMNTIYTYPLPSHMSTIYTIHTSPLPSSSLRMQDTAVNKQYD